MVFPHGESIAAIHFIPNPWSDWSIDYRSVIGKWSKWVYRQYGCQIAGNDVRINNLRWFEWSDHSDHWSGSTLIRYRFFPQGQLGRAEQPSRAERGEVASRDGPEQLQRPERNRNTDHRNRNRKFSKTGTEPEPELSKKPEQKNTLKFPKPEQKLLKIFLNLLNMVLKNV